MFWKCWTNLTAEVYCVIGYLGLTARSRLWSIVSRTRKIMFLLFNIRSSLVLEVNDEDVVSF